MAVQQVRQLVVSFSRLFRATADKGQSQPMIWPLSFPPSVPFHISLEQSSSVQYPVQRSSEVGLNRGTKPDPPISRSQKLKQLSSKERRSNTANNFTTRVHYLAVTEITKMQHSITAEEMFVVLV